MSDIFVSPNQPALFPLTNSFSSISKEDYHLFYKKDRSLLTILLVVLHREVVQSILVMGFLLWLEREGYTSKNLVESIISSLTPDLIDRVADEAVICLKLLAKKSNKFVPEGSSYDISMLQCLLDKKCMLLDDLYRDRDLIFDEVTRVANELSTKAFHDILVRFTRCGEPLVLHTPHEVNGNGFCYVTPDKYIANGEDSRQRNLLIDRLYARGNSSCVVRESKEEIPQENRTIFLTFSKGYPISENEVKDYFTRMYGDFIESIFMQPVEPENQPLFARIVARSTSMVSVVVDRDGTDGKSKYYINGKHVWARKYVKRTSSKDANGSLQP